MACEYCDIIEGKEKAWKIYEDDKAVAILSRKPSTLGHILIMPKEHYPIIEVVPDYIISHLAIVVNKLSVALFEGLNALGTNILINNGEPANQTQPHFMINIIPRREGDNLDFTWTPKQLSNEELSTVEMQIKEKASAVGHFEEEKKETVVEVPEEKVIDDDGEDYLLKHINRLP